MWTLIAYAVFFVVFLGCLVITQHKHIKHERDMIKHMDQQVAESCEVVKKKYKKRHGTDPKEFDHRSFKVIPLKKQSSA
jgi:hypothetical protein